MTLRWLILSNIISLSVCYFGDPFTQDLDNVRHDSQPDKTSRHSSSTNHKAVPKNVLAALVKNFEQTYADGIRNNEDRDERKRVVSLPRKEPRPIISSKLVDGSPKHFKEIVIGRCWEYQSKIGLKERERIDCSKVWSFFTQAFAYKGPCDVTTQDYLAFLEKIEEDVEKDKALLWTGCRELAHKLSDIGNSRRFTTLEDTLAGFMFSGLTWCGSKHSPGINYTSCPYECSIQAPFWAMANFKYAQKVHGIVHILLNGTRQHITDGNVYPSYLKDRYYFGPYVIPNLDHKKITEARIIVAHTLKMRPLESCGESSIKTLQNDLKEKGMKVTCYDDPDIVKHILCVDEPMLESCRIRAAYSK